MTPISPRSGADPRRTNAGSSEKSESRTSTGSTSTAFSTSPMRRSALSGRVTMSMSISAARTKTTRSAMVPSFGTPRTTGGER
jgi:hypothetical protein